MSKVKMAEHKASLKGIAKKKKEIRDLNVEESLPLGNTSYWD